MKYLPDIHKNGRPGDVLCAASLRTTDGWRSYQCTRKVKNTFTQEQFDGIMSDPTSKRAIFAPMALENHIGLGFCGTHDPVAIVAANVREQAAKDEVYDARRNREASATGRKSALEARMVAIFGNGPQSALYNIWGRDSGIDTSRVKIDMTTLAHLLDELEALRGKEANIA